MTTANRTDRELNLLKNAVFWLVTGFAAWASLTASVNAQEWKFDPIIKVGYEVDDNAVLSIRTDEEVSIKGYQADVTARVDYLSDVTTFSLIPRVRWRRYDKSQFDSTDYFARLVYRYRTRSSNFGVRSLVERESVRTAERASLDGEIDDTRDITNDDSGLVALGGNRDKVLLAPFWTYRFSKKMSITAELDYFDVSYSDVFADILADYTDSRLDLSFRRALSARTDAVVVGSARRYENDDQVLEFDSYGLMVGFERAISETTALRALVGTENLSFDATSVDDESDIVADISLVRTLETIRIIAQYKRSITAFGTRLPTVRDSFNLNFTRRLTEKITAGIGARAYQTELISGSSNIGQDYIKIQGGVGWNFNSTFLIEFEISHTIIDRGGVVGESADSNQAAIWFVYRPNTPTVL